MKEITQEQEISYGVCPECGKKIALPCLACQSERLRYWNRAGRPASREELTDDLAIRLENPDQQRRYEEVRNFRDKYNFPMWSEQWREMILNQFAPQS